MTSWDLSPLVAGGGRLKAHKKYHPWIRCSSDLVYSVTFPPDHTLEDLAAVCADVELISRRATCHFGFIIDFGQMTHSSPKGRSIVTGTERRINDMPSVRKYCRGMSLVVHTAFQRRVLTAVSWFARRPYDFVVVTSREEAERWVARRLLAARVGEVG